MRIGSTICALFWPLVLFQAQDVFQLTPGARLKVVGKNPEARAQVGAYQSLSDSTLRLQSGGTTLGVPLAAISRLEVSRGRKLSRLGGVLGFVLGGAAGGALGCLANKDDYGVFCGGQDDTKVILGAALGGVVGAALGATLLRHEHWTPLDLDRLRPPPVK